MKTRVSSRIRERNSKRRAEWVDYTTHPRDGPTRIAEVSFECMEKDYEKPKPKKIKAKPLVARLPITKEVQCYALLCTWKHGKSDYPLNQCCILSSVETTEQAARNLSISIIGLYTELKATDVAFYTTQYLMMKTPSAFGMMVSPCVATETKVLLQGAPTFAVEKNDLEFADEKFAGSFEDPTVFTGIGTLWPKEFNTEVEHSSGLSSVTSCEHIITVANLIPREVTRYIINDMRVHPAFSKELKADPCFKRVYTLDDLNVLYKCLRRFLRQTAPACLCLRAYIITLYPSTV
jgi:hypothetical protein